MDSLYGVSLIGYGTFALHICVQVSPLHNCGARTVVLDNTTLSACNNILCVCVCYAGLHSSVL